MKMEWINVKDRLPEDLEDILFFDGKDIFKGHISKSYMDEFHTWVSVSGNGIYDVTHWMPLPEPPQT